MKVLIVEDNSALRSFMDIAVRQCGHKTVLARDGEEGFQAFEKDKPDLILSDISMPRHNGLKLLERVRNQDHETIFVVMTGHGSEETARRALELRANNYLCKPVEFPVLRNLLQKYSRLTQRRRASEEVRALVVRRETCIEIPSRMDLVPDVVEMILSELSLVFPREEILDLQLGLYELIVNAIEHGNLELGFEEKQKLLESSPQDWMGVLEKRAGEERYRDRKVHITCRHERGTCEWVIEDEGRGFDPEAVPSCLGEGVEGLSGRGIFLARMQFDELSFLGRGNRVRARKTMNSTRAGGKEPAASSKGPPEFWTA